MNKEETNAELENRYPGVEFAYPIAVNSYEVSAKRLDAMDGRLQTILTLVATVSALIPTIANNRGVTFNSGWFFAAAFIFLIIIGLGTYGRLCGDMKVLKPSSLFESWLHLEKWEFEKEMIRFAAEDFDENISLSEFRWKITAAITALFALEVALAAVWVVRS